MSAEAVVEATEKLIEAKTLTDVGSGRRLIDAREALRKAIRNLKPSSDFSF